MRKSDKRISKDLTKRMKSDKTMNSLYKLERKRQGPYWNKERFPLQILSAGFTVLGTNPIINYLRRRLCPLDINYPLMTMKNGKVDYRDYGDKKLLSFAKTFAKHCKMKKTKSGPT